MKVFKFGGFSVSSAANIKQLVKIIKQGKDDQILIVVSAMGKTTDALEALSNAYNNAHDDTFQLLSGIKNYHEGVMKELFGTEHHPVFDEIANTFIEIEWMLDDEPHPDHDFSYDQIVSVGELLSSKIISAYLKECGLDNKWIDARSYIHTDNTYKEGAIDWAKTKTSISGLKDIPGQNIIISQGFIGGTSENFTTTLGREGSDYSAAVFASCLGAESLTVWKDVPGIMNADPALFGNAQKYERLPYSEALELAYYGANIIHPKTVKPLQNSDIPLYVKPFLSPDESGTRIDGTSELNTDIQAIIVKKNQTLLTVSTKDFSYMDETLLSILLKGLADAHIKQNMIQLSALSVSLSLDKDEIKLKKLTDQLSEMFEFSDIQGLSLLTILHFTPRDIDSYISGKSVLMEQFSKNKAQFILQ